MSEKGNVSEPSESRRFGEEVDVADPQVGSQSVLQLLGAASSIDFFAQDEGDGSGQPVEEDLYDVNALELDEVKDVDDSGSVQGDGNSDGNFKNKEPLTHAAGLLQSTLIYRSQQKQTDTAGVLNDDDNDSASLSTRLQEEFEFSAKEKLIAEYPCWLLKGSLLKGHIYITPNHICFYAYLPIKSGATLKTGYFMKEGQNTPSYSRLWAILKLETLSFYQNPTELYFPSARINLHYAIQALLHPTNDRKFILTCYDRKHSFMADSVASAREWVNAIEKAIFRLRSSGDAVKISIPIPNVLDVEAAPALNFADTVKISAIDGEDTYAIDEFLFSFFGRGTQVIEMLRQATDSTVAQKILEAVSSMDGSFKPPICEALVENILDSTFPKSASLTGSHPSVPTFQHMNSACRNALAHVHNADRWEGVWNYWMRKQTQMTHALVGASAKGYLQNISKFWLQDTNKPLMDYNAETFLSHLRPPSQEKQQQQYQAQFTLPESEKLIISFHGYLYRALPLRGEVYVSEEHLCFRSILPGSRTKLILPILDIENVEKERGFQLGWSGLVVVIRGHEDLFFEFHSRDVRDDCAVSLLKLMEMKYPIGENETLSVDENVDEKRNRFFPTSRENVGRLHSANNEQKRLASTIFESTQYSMIQFKPSNPLHFVCLTIGSRGDVQPYIALAKGLLAEGHTVTIATHGEFKEWVEQHGIEFSEIAGEPAELMRICVENGMFTYSFLREASSKFRGWLDGLLQTSWDACQQADVLIESPSAMGGIHIAEALGIPYFRAFTMPWTRTRSYPHAFAVPEHKMGGSYNYYTYVMFDSIFWKATAGQINRWRVNTLKLNPTSLSKLQANKVPFLYNFSPTVVPPPLDFGDWIKVTGYWFLNENLDWKPDQGLVDFIQAARDLKKPLVYIGFGSIVVSDADALTRSIVESVEKADVWCILSKGWSDKLESDVPKSVIELPRNIYIVNSVPHDWLFPQVDAAVHHGGSGTTGASLRAGIPIIIKPFFGDQFFYASRIEDLGVGIVLRKLNATYFSKLLWEVTHNERIIRKAAAVGEKIRAENGVEVAINTIYRELDYARSLVRHQKQESEAGFVEGEWVLVTDGGSDEYESIASEGSG